MTKRNYTPATCPACQGPMKGGAKCCTRCRSRNVMCQVCQQALAVRDRRCAECATALLGLTTGTDRPRDWTWPAGHIEALTQRATAGLPLFERGGAP
jgi:hypothetical protein